MILPVLNDLNLHMFENRKGDIKYSQSGLQEMNNMVITYDGDVTCDVTSNMAFFSPDHLLIADKNSYVHIREMFAFISFSFAFVFKGGEGMKWHKLHLQQAEV